MLGRRGMRGRAARNPRRADSACAVAFSLVTVRAALGLVGVALETARVVAIIAIDLAASACFLTLGSTSIGIVIVTIVIALEQAGSAEQGKG